MRSALIGREAELAELGELFADARTGGGRLALVAGEPGIGKSRLVDAAGRAARDGGSGVVWGRCWEVGGAPAYWPWIQVVRSLHREHADLALPPELAWMIAGAVAQSTVAEDRFVLFDAVLQYLAAAAQRRAIMLVLEDLHGADQPSLHLLGFVASHLAGAAILVIGTYRTSEARMTPEVGAIIDRLALTASVITPRRLDREHIATLVGDPASDEIVDAIYRTSEGNPLFACELLRLLQERPLADGRLSIPETVRAAIREHLQRLPIDLHELAGVAAVIGHDVSVSLLSAAAERDERATLAELRQLVEHGVLVDTGARGYRFAHNLFAETLHHDLAQPLRERLHARVADLLERELGETMLATLTHHLFEAGDAHTARAIESAIRAAEVASRQLASEEAIGVLERALGVTPRAALVTRCDLLVVLGSAQIQADQPDAGKATCCHAADLARTLGSGERLARAALAYGRAWSFGIVDRVLIELIDEALQALPPGDSSPRAQLLARRASGLQPANDPEVPMNVARDAIAMARRVGDERALLSVLYSAISALCNFAPGAERAPLDRETIELATRFDDRAIVLRSLYRLVLDYLEVGDLGSAALEHARYQTMAAGFRQPRIHFEAALLRSLFALHAGHLDEHRAVMADARTLSETLDAPWVDLYIIGFEIRSRQITDDPEVWLAGRQAYLALHRGAWQALYGLTATPFVLASAGDLDRARAAFARVDLDAVVTYGDLCVLGLVAETAMLLDDRDAGEMLYRSLAPHDGRWCVSGFPTLCIMGTISRLRCLLASFLGRTEDARRHASTMLTELCNAGSPLLHARGLIDWASSDACSPTEARASITEAKAIIARIGASLEGTLATAEARIATRVSPPTSDLAPATVARDGDTWVMSLAGASCRIKDSRGLALLAKLLEEPGREHHVLELVGAEVVDDGDAGEVIDREAIGAYRVRVHELRAEVDEAEAFNDLGRRVRAETELAQIEAELRASVALGGRPRRTAGAAERARVNVRRRIVDAIVRITELSPLLGQHLDASVRTGAFCSYDPRRAAR